MSERRVDDDPGRALARALADDRLGARTQRGDTVLFDGIARGALLLGRGVRALVCRIRGR